MADNQSGVTLAELLRTLRLAAGLTKRDLADRAAMSLRTINYLESGHVTRPRRRSLQALATALALDRAARALLLGTAIGTAIGIPHPAAKRLPDSPWPPVPVADGADPDAAGCGADAITICAKRIALRQRRLIVGQIELRYSPSTNAAWARFEGYMSLDYLARRHNIEVDLEIVRDDGAKATFRDPYAFDYTWTDLLLVSHHKLHASATLYLDDKQVANAQTQPAQPTP